MTGIDETAQMAAINQLNAALADYVRAQADTRVRQAYTHGRRAGEADSVEKAAQRVDSAVYRRGYQAGYKAARSGAAEAPFGSDIGRPRATTAPSVKWWGA